MYLLQKTLLENLVIFYTKNMFFSLNVNSKIDLET